MTVTHDYTNELSHDWFITYILRTNLQNIEKNPAISWVLCKYIKHMKASPQTQCFLLHAWGTYREILHNELYYTHSHSNKFNNRSVMFSLFFFSWNIKALHFFSPWYYWQSQNFYDTYLNRLFNSMPSVSISVATRLLRHRNNIPLQNVDDMNKGSKALIFSNNDILADTNIEFSVRKKVN